MLDRHALPFGHWLLNFPDLLKLLSAYVYFLELPGPLLIFAPYFLRPLRLGVMLCLMAMHTGFMLCLQLGPFPFVSLAPLSLFPVSCLWAPAARRRCAQFKTPPH